MKPIIFAFEHDRFENSLSFSKLVLPPAAQVGLAAVGGGTPDVISIGAIKHLRAVPAPAVLAPDGVAQVAVQVQFRIARWRTVTAVPRAGIDKESVTKDEEMWITRVPLRDREPVDLFPPLGVFA